MKDNCLLITKRVLKSLNVQYTWEYMNEMILSHPDYPSMLCIADTLSKYKIKNMAVEIEDKAVLKELSKPSVLQINRSDNSVFCVFVAISHDKVSFYNEYDQLETMHFKAFLDLWTGVCLLVEKTKDTRESGLEKRLYGKRLKYILFGFLFLCIGIYLFMGWKDFSIASSSIYIFIYAFVKLCGIVVGSFLLWFETDQYNPTLQKLCTGGRKINCNSVLNSKYARFLKGNISLSLLSFSYFFAGFCLLFFTGFNYTAFTLLSFFSLGTLVVILLSAYSQGFVIKQWCKFCIAVQLILATEAIIVLLSPSYKYFLEWEQLALLGVFFVLPILLWLVLKPVLLRGKEAVFYKRNFAKIKFNPDIFFALLQKSRAIPEASKDLGIFLENKNAVYTIIKVCNPYCGPCAMAHPVLDRLYKEGKVNLQIIFTVSLLEEDQRTPPVKHLLGLFELYNKKADKTMEVLDAWYEAKIKNYDIFSSKYPVKKEELKAQNKNIELMHKWCEQTKIMHTPTIFINGYELPEEYSVQDLKEIL